MFDVIIIGGGVSGMTSALYCLRNGKKVLYLEEINTNFKGNNPHTGKGKYDFGLSYLLKYKQLFKDERWGLHW